MRKKKSNMSTIIAVLSVVVVIAMIIHVSKPKTVNYEEMTEEELQIAVQNKIDNMKVNELYGMGERDRMEYYVKSFIDAVENKEYEVAYDMLYDDFKNNYFPTLDDFEKYAKKTFPTLCSIEHTNIERNGEVYVLWVKLSNALGGKDTAVEMNFVIQENDLNDFVMSFTVI